MKKIQLIFFLLCIGINVMAQWNTSSNNIYNTNSSNVGITIASTNTGSSNIFFADTDSPAQGQIKYQHSGDYMRFYTANLGRVGIANSGNVGMGTTPLFKKLDVGSNSNTTGQYLLNGTLSNVAYLDQANIFSEDQTVHGAIRSVESSGRISIQRTDDAGFTSIKTINSNGQTMWEFGTGFVTQNGFEIKNQINNIVALRLNETTGDATLGGSVVIPNGDWFRTKDTNSVNRALLGMESGTNNVKIQTGGLSSSIFFQTGTSVKAVLDQNGNLGIGTTTPDQKLTVKGKIHAEEVIIDLNVPAPDYVFEPDYQLRDLDELQQFIETNKHLPEVPSAATMEEEGISVSEMNMLLLKKVEELTLYILEQKEQISSQNSRIDKLEKLLNQ